MPTRTITTRLALTGESESRAALKQLNAQFQLYRSELAKAEAQYKTSANSMEALTARQSALGGQLDALNRKHREQEAMLQKARQVQREYAYQVEQSGGKLERARAKLEELKKSTGDTSAVEARLTAEVEKHTKALAAAQENQQKAGNAVNSYQRQLNNTERDQANLNHALAQNSKYLDEARASADGCASSIDQYGRQVRQAGEDSVDFGGTASSAVDALAAALAAAGVTKTVQEIAAALRECAEASIEFENAMAGVRRTVGVAGPELTALGDSFKQMSTEMPITTTELGKIAETAGQLGIAKDRVEEFSTIMAQLGTTTDLTAENAAAMLAQFANITGLTDYERLGATVAELGDATATTASKVVEMSQGMAAAADMAGFQETEILALAAAVGSLGIESQAGSTAMSTLIANIHKAVELGGDDLAHFAAVADMSAEQFAQAWREDAAGTFTTFIQGLNDVERNGRSAMVILDELGITNVRQTKAILGLANAGDLLSNTISQANRAWEENAALTEKAAIMYETTGAKLAMAENAANNLKIAIGDALAPALNQLAGAGTEAFSWAAEFVEEHPWLVQALTGVAAAMGVLVAGTTAMMIVEKLTPMIHAFNAALAANPAIAVAAAIAGVVVAITALSAAAGKANGDLERASGQAEDLADSMDRTREAYKQTTEAIRAQGDEISAMVATLDALIRQEEQTGASKASILELVDQLNAAMPELSLVYDEQTGKLTGLATGADMTTEALLELAVAQERLAQQQANIQRLAELQVEQEQITRQLEEATRNFNAELEKNKDYVGWVSREQAEWRDIMAGLQKELEENEAEVARLTGTVEDYVQAENTARSGLARTAAQIDEAQAALDRLTQVIGRTKDAYDILSRAQGEQNETGYLTLDTVLELMKQYPGLRQYVIETADGYRLADGALQDYMTAQRAEYELALHDAQAAADAITTAEADKINAINATTLAAKDQLAALAGLYQSMGANAENEAEASSWYAKANEYRAAAQELEEAGKALETFERVSASYFRTGGTGGGKKPSGGSGKQSAAKEEDPYKKALEELQDFLDDADHQVYLWGKQGGFDRAILDKYQEAQEKVHALAEDFRARGLEENADEIQKLQTLWWGYQEDALALRQDMYGQELAELEEALEAQTVTWEDYLAGRQALEARHLSGDAQALEEAQAGRRAAEKQRLEDLRQDREDAYDEGLADLKYFLDLDLISEEDYWQRRLALTEQYLTEDSEKRRQAQVEIYQHAKEQREKALEEAQKAYQEAERAAESAYQSQLSALEKALKEKQSAISAALKEEQDAAAQQYKAAKETLSARYKEEKTAAQAAYEEKKAAIQAELDLEKERLNAILEGIEAEIQARRELREDEDQDSAIERAQKRLDAARAELAFARTDEDRAEWEKEVIRRQAELDQAVQNKEDTLFYREKEAEKEAVKDQIAQAGAAAKEQQNQASAEYRQNLDKLEKDYTAALAQAEASYQAALERAQASCEAALAQAQAEYEAAVRDAQRARSSGGGGGSGGGGYQEIGGKPVYSEEVRAISRANDVDLFTAGAMWRANQSHKDDPSYQPYSDGGYSARARAAVGSAGSASGGGSGGSGGGKVVNNNVSITVNSPSAFTEGQMARLVEKGLEKASR